MDSDWSLPGVRMQRWAVRTFLLEGIAKLKY